MSRRALLIVIGLALMGAGGLFAGGYAFGTSKAPSDRDAAKARAVSKRRALSHGRTITQRKLDAIRVGAGGPAARRGRAAGVQAGRSAGQQEIAARGAGPTQLPTPLVPTDAYDAPATGFTERPSKVLLTNHGGAEGVTWSSYGGETATGSGTLTGSDCKPNCAEGKPTRDPITLTASDPQFTPQNKRFYAKLVVEPQGKPSFTVRINPTGAPAIE